MIYKPFQNIQLSRLGMGNMRLPAVNPGQPNSPIDYPKAHEIIDYAYEHGVNYYDTAYVYNDGESERCLGAAMKKYPRESFYIADKFNLRANPDYKAVFAEQLQRLQVDYIDFYLIHCVMDGNVDDYLKSGAIEYFQQLKKEGKIRYLGFSSHGSVETLRRFADAAKWDFAQIQLNYYDSIFGSADEEYHVLAERNIPVMVMEPVRGGRLASLTPETDAMLKQAHPDWSIASWALRFVHEHPMVQVILSGMSNMEQVMDNVKTFSGDPSLSEADLATLTDVCRKFREQIQVPCTACRYCTSTCPMEINIPEFLKYFNAYKIEGFWGLDGVEKVDSAGVPSQCVGCGACMEHCPQKIEIPNLMSELAEAMEKMHH